MFVTVGGTKKWIRITLLQNTDIEIDWDSQVRIRFNPAASVVVRIRKHDQTVGHAGPNRATIERPKYRWWRVSKKRSYLSLEAAGTAPRKGRKREWKKPGRRDTKRGE